MRILVVEDDVKTAAFIVNGLKEAGYSVEHAHNSEEGLRWIVGGPFDAVVADVMLPGMDGLAMIAEFRRRKITTPTIILSAKGSVDDRIKGLQSGGDDYLPKPFSFSELLARIQALIRRASATADPVRLSVGDLTLNVLTREVRRGNRKIELQPKEFALLDYLMRSAGRVVSKTMIIEHVWDYNFDPLTNVVEARICRLRDKIDRPFDRKLIHTIHGVGYVLREDE